ncbi:MAG: phenylalanine--tRNA ligase subunit beta [Gammaproteobacteria bacterium]|nr:phenylalanine--tRNA ligase subunit beta [Gammaproteobacteria bacterium]
MKFSKSWLQEWLDVDLSAHDMANKLTMLGLETDSITPVAGDFTGVVVGEIITANPHPNADKLQVCSVSIDQDEDPLQIVCGAPNARSGIKVAVAKICAKLPGDFKIKATKLRGVDSFGMLCSSKELGLSDASSGILELPDDAPIGKDLREYLKLDDCSIELELTINRGDCLSILGLARELAADTSTNITPPPGIELKTAHNETLNITLDAPQRCAFYAGCIIRDINPNAKTPLWMIEKLRRSGINAISPVVDVTNYVLLELGQPMHAFDLAKISGDIHARLAKADEELTLLDEKQLKLTANDLVISDDKNPLALAGVMGGFDSRVTDKTMDIFLESAWFAATGVALSARHHTLHTDSSHRFERGVDPSLPTRAIKRAIQLLLDIVGGKPGPINIAKNANELPISNKILLRFCRIKRLLGIDIPKDKIKNMLALIGCEIISDNESSLKVSTPLHRFDLVREIDLIEEVARIYGYNNIPEKLPEVEVTFNAQNKELDALMRAHNLLINEGYRETITYSFVDKELQELLDQAHKPITLKNPISADMGVMRSSIWPGLITALRYNLNRRRRNLRFFESGLCFTKDKSGNLEQELKLSGLLYGNKYEEQWAVDNKIQVDFFDLKNDLSKLFSSFKINENISWKPVNHPTLHPGKSAEIFCNGKLIGYCGALHPRIQSNLQIEKNVYLFELKFSAIYNTEIVEFKPLSKFPEVARDLALLIDKEMSAASLIELIGQLSGPLLRRVTIFDLYEGDQILKTKKSIAISLQLQHSERTLTEDDINEIMSKLLVGLKDHNVLLRE